MGPIQIKEFDFSTGKNKEDNVIYKDGKKLIANSEWKEAIEELKKKETNAPSSTPEVKTQVRTRVWNSDPKWFDGYMITAEPSEPALPKRVTRGNQNIMEIQEKAVADAYAKFLTAKREYLQQKKTLNQLYDAFEVSELKDSDG